MKQVDENQRKKKMNQWNEDQTEEQVQQVPPKTPKRIILQIRLSETRMQVETRTSALQRHLKRPTNEYNEEIK
jgi:hypothetical protein